MTLNFRAPKLLDQFCDMPKISAAFAGWWRNYTVGLITQIISDGDAADTVKSFSFRGLIQPMGPRRLSLKPEGQRAWKWLIIHVETGFLNLMVQDIIIYNSRQYKVMSTIDYSINGYFEYEVADDYVVTP